MIELTQKKVKRAGVKFPPDLHKEMSHYSIDEGISMAEVVRRGWDALKAADDRDAADHEPGLNKTLRLVGQSVPTSKSDESEPYDRNTTDPVRIAVRDSTLTPSERAWVEALIHLVASGAGATQFRQLLAILQSEDQEIIDAISRNLAVFVRIEAVQKVLRDERENTDVPLAEEADIGGRAQETLGKSDDAIRKSRGIIGAIEDDGEADQGDRQTGR